MLFDLIKGFRAIFLLDGLGIGLILFDAALTFRRDRRVFLTILNNLVLLY
jgi:hypothetical protein